MTNTRHHYCQQQHHNHFYKNIYYYHINKDDDSDMYFPIKMNNDDGKVLFSYKEEGIEHSFVHYKIM